MKKVGIIGASGYTGNELVKILSHHQNVELVALNSAKHAGRKVSELYSDCGISAQYTNYSPAQLNDLDLDALFLATPNGAALSLRSQLSCSHIIDLSADYRFKDCSLYAKIYGISHSDEVGARMAVYGLPELFREKIKSASLIANPGCFATASLLSALPIAASAKSFLFDCKSGWSGAGKESAYAKDPSSVRDNLIAYKLTDHRHGPEIAQFLSAPLGFTPHVFGAFRGMMATAHIFLPSSVSCSEIIESYRQFYASHPFVKITADKIPQIKDVVKTNQCHIGGFEQDGNNRLVVVSVIDNLLKGASGQAVQNMNLMLGLKETDGLNAQIMLY